MKYLIIYLIIGIAFRYLVKPYNFPYDHRLSGKARVAAWPIELGAYALGGFKNGYSFVEDVTGGDVP